MLTKKFLILWLIIIAIIGSGCSSQPRSSTPDAPNSQEQPNILLTETTTDEVATTPALKIENPPLSPSIPMLIFGVEDQALADYTESVINAANDFTQYQTANITPGSVVFDIHIVQFQQDTGKSIEETLLESIRRHKPLMILMAAPVNENLYSEIQNARVPVLYFGFGAPAIEFQTRSRDYLFWLVPPPSEQYAFVLEQLWANWEQVRPPGNMNEFRIANLSWETPPNRLGLVPKIIEFLEQNNFALTLEGEMRKSPNASTTNFLLQCIPSGVSVIYTDTISYGPMVLLNDMHTLGLNGFFVVSGSTWAFDPGNMKYLIAPEHAEKFYLPLPSKWWVQEDHPSIQTAIQILRLAERPDSDQDLAYLLGLGAMDIMAHVVQETLKAQEGDLISVSDVYTQLSSLEDHAVLDGLFEVDYSDGNRSPRVLRLWLVSSGTKWVPVGSPELIPDFSKEDSQ